MRLHKLIKPAVLLATLPLAFSASAGDSMKKKVAEYNFATVKAGGVFPTSLEGNSGLNTGDTTYAVGFEVGRKIMNRYAVSLEYRHRGKNTAHGYGVEVENSNGNSNSWSARSDAIMLNGAVDLVVDSKVVPYFKVGLGAARNKSNDYRNKTTDPDGLMSTQVFSGDTVNKFAWQAGAGLNMSTCSMFDTQIEYMFVDSGEITTKVNYVDASGVTQNSPARTGRLKDHVLTIGLKFKF
ncbi:MAG: outer membrane beta-barrel protein [Rickettsiales bacterium]|jgi:opacity protein-like surface antigen|nr:outer membrane beta-barrel protein [Rickettsiales bacterium]